MLIGLVIGLHDGGPDGDPAPRWHDIQEQVVAAEEVGFDLVILEDAMSFGGGGYWEAMTIAGAICAATTTITVSHSVVNAPLRRPAIVARAAHTLDEISGGRYVLGIGAGNSPDDYEQFAIPADPRYSRFAEAVTVIHGLLRNSVFDYDGAYETAHTPRFAPRGPRPSGPPLVIAAGGPKMLRLCARLADGWNWWGSPFRAPEELPAIIDELERACAEEGRDPASIDRSVDVYTYDPLGITGENRSDWVFTGTTDEIAASILRFAEIGIDEVRVDVAARLGGRVDAVAAMAPVVDAVHRG